MSGLKEQEEHGKQKKRSLVRTYVMLNTFVTQEIWSPRKLKMLDYKIAEEYLSSCNVFKSALLVAAQPSMETLEPN